MNEPPPATAFAQQQQQQQQHHLAAPVPPHFRLESQSHHQLDLEHLAFGLAAAAAAAADATAYPGFHGAAAAAAAAAAAHHGLPQLHPSSSSPTTANTAAAAASLGIPPPPPADVDPADAPAGDARPHGTLSSKMVPNPPQLAEWRTRLFNVDELIIMTHDEFETYFPHIDNVYSHRSTQKYKRKPFVSHYWDCRMKGRPPGTPKSEDPNKKKRKRQARERDLCDVKIKITEYFAGASLNMLDIAGSLPSGSTLPLAVTSGDRFWTVQRVNGNGGNGKGEGVAGPHKHTLEKSDEIKKNSVQRHFSAQEKESKKTTPKNPLRRPTGAAAVTAKKHAKDSDMKLYAACFCPFSQRVWIALEAKGLSYQYCEVDPFKKPRPLLEANPRGLVPAIRGGDWACGESGVILEYLEDLDRGPRLFPTEPRLKAICRLWIDHINARIVPSFFYLLHASDAKSRNDGIERLQRDIKELVDAADEQGPYFLGSEMCLVDVHFAPFAIRLSRILTPFRQWTDVPSGTRWQQWLRAISMNPHVQVTTCTADLYIDTVDALLNSRTTLPESR